MPPEVTTINPTEYFIQNYHGVLVNHGISHTSHIKFFRGLLENPDTITTTILQDGKIAPILMFNNIHLKLYQPWLQEWGALADEPYPANPMFPGKSNKTPRQFWSIMNTALREIYETHGDTFQPVMSRLSFVQTGDGIGELNPESYLYSMFKSVAPQSDFSKINADTTGHGIMATELLLKLYQSMRQRGYEHLELWQ